MVDRCVLPANVLFVGATNSGKTYCFKYMYRKYWRNQVKMTYLISPTAEISGDFEGLISDKYILSDMKLASFKIQEIAEFCHSQKLKKKHYPVMLIIDDCLGVVDFNSKEFCHLMAMSRHINLTIVLMMQNLTRYMSPSLRNNLSYIFVNRMADSNVKCLYELCGCWPRIADLRTYLQANLINYQTVLIDKKSIENPAPIVFRAQ